MAASGTLLAPFLFLLLVSATPLVQSYSSDDIKSDCNETKNPELCLKVLLAHPECNTKNITGADVLSMQVAAKIAREADVFARAKVEDVKTPSACISYCVRDICSVAKRMDGLPAVITIGDWERINSLFVKKEITLTCGKSCPEKPSADEQAVVQKFNELRDALNVMRDLAQVTNDRNEKLYSPKGVV